MQSIEMTTIATCVSSSGLDADDTNLQYMAADGTNFIITI